MSLTLDTASFSAAVYHKRVEVRGRGLRQAAKEIGTTASTLQRIESGKLPDLPTFLKLCAWLGKDVPFANYQMHALQTQLGIKL